MVYFLARNIHVVGCVYGCVCGCVCAVSVAAALIAANHIVKKTFNPTPPDILFGTLSLSGMWLA